MEEMNGKLGVIGVDWESFGDFYSRTKVPKGWLVVVHGYSLEEGELRSASATFVPDEHHKWKLKVVA